MLTNNLISWSLQLPVTDESFPACDELPKNAGTE